MWVQYLVLPQIQNWNNAVAFPPTNTNAQSIYYTYLPTYLEVYVQGTVAKLYTIGDIKYVGA